jgi:hypothetical protein
MPPLKPDDTGLEQEIQESKLPGEATRSDQIVWGITDRRRGVLPAKSEAWLVIRI